MYGLQGNPLTGAVDLREAKEMRQLVDLLGLLKDRQIWDLITVIGSMNPSTAYEAIIRLLPPEGERTAILLQGAFPHSEHVSFSREAGSLLVLSMTTQGTVTQDEAERVITPMVPEPTLRDRILSELREAVASHGTQIAVGVVLWLLRRYGIIRAEDNIRQRPAGPALPPRENPPALPSHSEPSSYATTSAAISPPTEGSAPAGGAVPGEGPQL